MNLNQYAVYQLKDIPENRKLRFRPYSVVHAQGIRIQSENYQQVYIGMAMPEDTLKNIYEKLLKSPPKRFAGHRISVSDVIAHNKDGRRTKL